MKKSFEEKWANRGLTARLLRPKIAKLALKFELDPVLLDRMSENLDYLCAICLQPFVTPHIYFWPAPDGRQIPRGVLCSDCMGAIRRCEDDLDRLKKHKRFLFKLRRGRALFQRFMILNMRPSLFDLSDEPLCEGPDPGTLGTAPPAPANRSRSQPEPVPDPPERSGAT